MGPAGPGWCLTSTLLRVYYQRLLAKPRKQYFPASHGHNTSENGAIAAVAQPLSATAVGLLPADLMGRLRFPGSRALGRGYFNSPRSERRAIPGQRRRRDARL